MTHPIEQAADAVERELADLRAKLAVAVGALKQISLEPLGSLSRSYARAALAQVKGGE